MESPEYVRTSLAAAMTLDLEPGRFYRDAKLYCINLLLTYSDGCLAKCAYCGLSGSRPGVYEKKSFIRVKWPVYPVDVVIDRMKDGARDIRRVCISMVTRKRAVGHTIEIAGKIASATDIPISLLISPTVTTKEDLVEYKKAGADKIGIAIDAATEELFDKWRGRGVGGPHKWSRYWGCFKEAIEIFGEGNVGSHFIVGLGETEKQMVSAIQAIKDMGGETHLFSFFPEAGSIMASHPIPPLPVYRRIQIARFLIDNGIGRADKMEFDDAGRIVDFGIDKDLLDGVIDAGECFMTSGCVGKDGKVACNRPFANERPSMELRNFPFSPNAEDVAKIRQEIWSDLM